MRIFFLMAQNEVPFVLLPEVAGERNQQHRGEGPEPCAELHPELHARACQRFLLGQRCTSYAQLRLRPHIQQVLRSDTHLKHETSAGQTEPESHFCVKNNVRTLFSGSGV